MPEPQQTSILIRVQARSGKFLGPNVQYSQITILNGPDVIFGPVIASGGSGTVDPKTGDPFNASWSRDVIAVQASPSGPPAGAYWLEPGDSGAAGVLATFPLAEPALLEFRATALYESVHPVTTSTMMWVYPGMQLTSEPGLLLSIPGLYVSLPPPEIGEQIDVTATVTMMCGCPITTPTWPEPSGGPEPYWPETEFEVVAILTPASGPAVTQKMTFADTNTFTASFALPEAGAATIAVYALQQAESNVGYAQQTITVT